MNLSRFNFILVLLILPAILFLFLFFVKTYNQNSFNGKRIDELEKRPIQASNQLFLPEAGESGKTISTSTPAPNLVLPTLRSTPTPPPVLPARITTYLPIYGGNAQTAVTSWVDVAGSDFQLKASDFGKTPYFNWEAIAWVIGGSGNINLRLFDSTNGVAVSGSEISGSSSKPILISSGKLNFFSGNNTYKVQISSQLSSTVQFDFGRLKIVY